MATYLPNIGGRIFQPQTAALRCKTVSNIGTLFADIDPGVSGSTFANANLTTAQSTNAGTVGSVRDQSGNNNYAGGGSSAADFPNLITSGLKGLNCLAFDGIYDRLVVQNSAAFQPHSGGYHIEFVWRPDFFRYMTPLGHTATSAEKGLYTAMIETRRLQIIPCKGSAGTPVVDFTPTYTYTVGSWVRTSIWCDPAVGTNGATYHAVNGGSTESKANTSAFGSGNSARALAIGASPASGGQYFQDMGFARLLIYSACLTSGARAVLNSLMLARYGL